MFDPKNPDYQSLFENIHEAALLLWPNGYIADANHNMIQLSGYNREELVDKNLTFLIDKDNSENWHKFFNLSEVSKQVIFQVNMILKDFSRVKVEMVCSYFVPNDGVFEEAKETGAIIAVCRNMTLHVKILNEIKTLAKNHYQYYQSIVENGNDGVIIVQANGLVLDATPKALSLTGYTHDEIMGVDYRDLLIEPGQQTTEMTLNEIDRIFPPELLFNRKLKTKQGDFISVKVRADRGLPVKGLDTAMLFVYTMTEYYEFIKYFQNEELIMQKVLQAIQSPESTGVLMYKIAGRITFANEFICKQLGYKKEELEKLTVNDIVDPEDFGMFIDNAIDMFAGQSKQVSFSAHFIRKNRSLCLLKITLKKYVEENLYEYLVVIIDEIQEVKDKARPKPNSELINQLLSSVEDQEKKAIVIGKAGGGTVFVNDKFSKEFGYSAKHPQDIILTKFVPSSEYKHFFKMGMMIFTGIKRKVHCRAKFICADGNFAEADFEASKNKIKGATYFIMEFTNIISLNLASV